MRLHLIVAALFAISSLSIAGIDKLKDPDHQAPRSHDAQSEHEDAQHSAVEHSGGEHSGGEHSGGEHSGGEHNGGEHHAKHKIIATSPVAKDVTLTQQYVCQIHSRRHIEVCTLESGYLKEICVSEGQQVQEGQSMFRILPTLYEARLDADLAEAQLAQVEYDNTQSLVQQNIVSPQELKLAKAKLAKAFANVKLAQAELDFTDIKAPFDGIVDRLHEQEGSLVDEGAMLTTMSDNSVMWVYFNVPESRYLEYQAAINAGQGQDGLIVQLKLANHEIFDHSGTIGAIEADFDNETGNIAFRADFPNPDGLLRHGQTGTVLIHEMTPGAIVIPQRATFEILAKKYVYVIDEDRVVHQREIVIQNEKDDIFLVAEGLEAGERIVLEGIRQVRDGETIEYDFEEPETVLANLKYHAE